MIRKLQIKFVAMCMILVTAVLGVVFTAVFFRQAEHRGHQPSGAPAGHGGRPPSGRPDLGLNRGRGRRSAALFHGESLGPQRNLRGLCHRRTYSTCRTHRSCRPFLQDCLQQNQPEGTIHSYGLRYLRRDYGLYERIAFVDMSMEQATLAGDDGLLSANRVWRHCCCFWAFSILLARWATRPVAKKAWRQQRQFLSDASPRAEDASDGDPLQCGAAGGRAAGGPPARWADNIR